jgi:SSS family solute:Na+ symporter
VLHWPLSWTCVFIGALVILYTTTGGAKAVGVTHKQQMAVMFGGLFVAFGLVVWYLREHIGFVESLQLASALGKTEVIDTSFDPGNKYTLWSGLHRRLLPAAGLLRHGPKPGAALPQRAERCSRPSAGCG